MLRTLFLVFVSGIVISIAGCGGGAEVASPGDTPEAEDASVDGDSKQDEPTSSSSGGDSGAGGSGGDVSSDPGPGNSASGDVPVDPGPGSVPGDVPGNSVSGDVPGNGGPGDVGGAGESKATNAGGVSNTANASDPNIPSATGGGLSDPNIPGVAAPGDPGGSASPGDPNGGVPTSDGATGGIKNAKKPETFGEFVAQAFQQGKADDALQYHFADILTTDAAAKDQKLHWVEGLQVPKTAIRWGVGVDFSSPKEFDDELPLIGNLPGAKNNRGGSAGLQGPSGGPSQASSSGGGNKRGVNYQKGTDKTGEIGARFAERLDMRRVRGYYGKFLQEASAAVSTGQGASRGSSKNKNEQVFPGLDYLGEGSDKELIDLAKERRIDVLAIFDVKISQLRGKKTGKSEGKKTSKNETKIRLILVQNGREVRATRAINNIKVALDREKLDDPADDPVDLMIDQVFDYADEHFRVSELPTLDSEKAKNRARSLIATKSENPLQSLAELRFYHTQKLLTDEELAISYKLLLDEENGAKLATGSEEEKAAAIGHLLPGNAPGKDPEKSKPKGKTPVFR